MIIYCATNKTNGMRYVGKTACGLQKRKRNHESDARKDSRLYFHRAIKKYGADGFTWDVIYRLYSGNLSKLISGKQKSHKGWRMAGGCE